MLPVTTITYINGFKVYPKAWLPNQEGFKFLSVLADGTIETDVVVKDCSTGLHSIKTWHSCIGVMPININKTV